METASKKEIFKLLIQEFLESPAPDVIRRDLNMPVDAEKVVTIYGPRRSGKSFFFDEIQNIGGWELFIRRIFDKERVKIFLTGSSSKLLSREIATSLRGRTLS